MDIGLGGNATHVETGATSLGALEDDDLQALLGGLFSGAVPTRARADDDEISLYRHEYLF